MRGEAFGFPFENHTNEYLTETRLLVAQGLPLSGLSLGAQVWRFFKGLGLDGAPLLFCGCPWQRASPRTSKN